jgi:hypothetical protein
MHHSHLKPAIVYLQALDLQAVPALEVVLASKAEALGKLVTSSSSCVSTCLAQGPGSTGSGISASTSLQGPGTVQQVSARVHGLDARRRGVYQALQQQLLLCAELLNTLFSIARRALSFAQEELADRQSKQDTVGGWVGGVQEGLSLRQRLGISVWSSSLSSAPCCCRTCSSR